MNFDYSEEQQLLTQSVRQFLTKEYTFAARQAIIESDQGYSEQVWDHVCRNGPAGAALCERGWGLWRKRGRPDAGHGSDWRRAYCRALPGQHRSGWTVHCQGRQSDPAAGDAAGSRRGRCKLAFAQTEREARYNLAHVACRAEKTANGYRLEGEKCVVLHAPCADKLIVSARTAGSTTAADGISLLIVDPSAPGVTLTPYRTIDNLRRRGCAFRRDGCSRRCAGRPGRTGPAADRSRGGLQPPALVCAEAVGAMQFANDTTLEYLKTRKQFGVPIGSFQALQHRMVEMTIVAEQARSMACLACVKADSADADERRRTISAAKIHIADACRHISQEAVQLHGGMGMTEEIESQPHVSPPDHDCSDLWRRGPPPGAFFRVRVRGDRFSCLISLVR